MPDTYEQQLQQAERGESPRTMGEEVREQGRARREAEGARERGIMDVFRNLRKASSRDEGRKVSR